MTEEKLKEIERLIENCIPRTHPAFNELVRQVAKHADQIRAEAGEDARNSVRLIGLLISMQGGEIRVPDVDMTLFDPHGFAIDRFEDPTREETVFRLRRLPINLDIVDTVIGSLPDGNNK